MRRTRAVATSAVVVLLAAAVLVWALSRADINRYRGQVQSAVAERLHREVLLGPMDVSLFPFGLRVSNIAIAEDPGFQTGRPFIEAEELYVSLRPLPLFLGRFELRSLELRRPVVELVCNAAGTWNFITLGQSAKNEGKQPTLLHRLVLTNGQVAVTDLRAKTERAVYRNIDAQIDDYAPRRPFGVALAVTLPGTGPQRLTVNGTAGPLVPDRAARTPFDGAVEFEEVSISGLQRFLQFTPLEGTDSIISGSMRLSSRDGRMSSKGSLRMEQTRARGLALGYPITAAFDIVHDSATDGLTIKEGTVRLDQTPLSLTGDVDLQPATPVLNAHITASDVALAEAARLASAFGVAFGQDTRVQGRLSADVRARGPANRPTLEGQAHLRDVSISGADIPRPVRTPAVDFTLTPREIRSNDFSATTNGTSLAVRFALSDYAAATPAIDAVVRTTDADLGEALNIARAWGVRAASGLSGTGRLTLDVRASGRTDSPSYSGSGSVTEGMLKSRSVAQPFRVRSANIVFSSKGASVKMLAASIGGTTADGSFTVRNFAAPQVDFQLSADKLDVAEVQKWLVPDPAPQTPQAGESMFLRTTGSGQVRIGSITHGQLVLDNAQADVTLDRGVVSLKPLAAGLFAGRYRGSIVVDARQTPTTLTVAGSLEGVDANRLASAVSNLRDVIYGALASVVRVKFSTNGTENIAPSLNGTLSLDLRDGRIANMDLIHEVGTIARFITGENGGEPFTRVRSLHGSFTVTNGVAHTDDLMASIDEGSLGADGSISLVNQALNLRATVVLSRDFSQRVGGMAADAFLGTVLANRQGELVVPLLLTGTMQQPRFAPDVQRIAEMKLRNLVPTARNPQELTSGILGAILGQQPRPETPSTPERKDPTQRLQDALREILGGGIQSEPGAPAK